MCYCMVNPPCSNFRIITVIFGVPEFFTTFTVDLMERYTTIHCTSIFVTYKLSWHCQSLEMGNLFESVRLNMTLFCSRVRFSTQTKHWGLKPFPRNLRSNQQGFSYSNQFLFKCSGDIMWLIIVKINEPHQEKTCLRRCMIGYDSNQSALLKKLASVLKLPGIATTCIGIWVANNKGTDQTAWMGRLICAFVRFHAYCMNQFCHDVAQILSHIKVQS